MLSRKRLLCVLGTAFGLGLLILGIVVAQNTAVSRLSVLVIILAGLIIGATAAIRYYYLKSAEQQTNELSVYVETLNKTVEPSNVAGTKEQPRI